MADVTHRQLPALICAALLAATGVRAFAEAASQSTPGQELQAALLLEMTVEADGTSAEELEKLSRVYSELEAKYPEHAAIKNAFAEFLWGKEKHEQAVEKWQAAEKLDPKNAAVLDHLGGAWLGRGEARKAADYFGRAAEADPVSAVHHFNAGNVIFVFRHELDLPEASAFEIATRHFAEASRLAPENADYAQAYAEIFYTVPHPDWSAALAAWKRFRQASPNADFALANLARVHLKLGEKDEARACLAQIQSPTFGRLKSRLLERIEAE